MATVLLAVEQDGQTSKHTRVVQTGGATSFANQYVGQDARLGSATSVSHGAVDSGNAASLTNQCGEQNARLGCSHDNGSNAVSSSLVHPEAFNAAAAPPLVDEDFCADGAEQGQLQLPLVTAVSCGSDAITPALTHDGAGPLENNLEWTCDWVMASDGTSLGQFVDDILSAAEDDIHDETRLIAVTIFGIRRLRTTLIIFFYHMAYRLPWFVLGKNEIRVGAAWTHQCTTPSMVHLRIFIHARTPSALHWHRT